MSECRMDARLYVSEVPMETTLKTGSYQDPLEDFERRFSWTFVFTGTNSDAAVHIVADDGSGREIALPVGALKEIARALS